MDIVLDGSRSVDWNDISDSSRLAFSWSCEKDGDPLSSTCNSKVSGSTERVITIAKDQLTPGRYWFQLKVSRGSKEPETRVFVDLLTLPIPYHVTIEMMNKNPSRINSNEVLTLKAKVIDV